MTNILFVDDEPRVLEGLQGLLRKHRKRWNMEFVVGGQCALDVLAERPFDVVVTDLKMPHVDGFAILQYLATRHPETIRIVLSGQAELGSAVAVTEHAHQALTKPCRAGELEAVLERACALRELIVDEEVRRALGRVNELPALPLTYTRLATMANDDRCGASDFANVVASDIAISASVLKLANSGFFAGGRKIGTVAQAVSLLGLDTVQSVALTSALFDTRTMLPAGRVFAEDLQEHSTLVAGLAAKLAGSLRREAFAAAMLHDVGRMVLALQMPEVKDGSTSAMRQTPSNIEPPECIHPKIGGYLLGLWGLPFAVFDAVTRHHQEPPADANPLAASIYWAERIVEDVVGDGRPNDQEIDEMHQLATARALELAQAPKVSAEKAS
jgi:HD-like signal output (HDOD) protein